MPLSPTSNKAEYRKQTANGPSAAKPPTGQSARGVQQRIAWKEREKDKKERKEQRKENRRAFDTTTSHKPRDLTAERPAAIRPRPASTPPTLSTEEGRNGDEYMEPVSRRAMTPAPYADSKQQKVNLKISLRWWW